MPTPRRDRLSPLGEWVAEALPILGLAHWRVRVSPAPASQDAWAEIEPHDQSDDAELFVGWDLYKQSPDRVREVLAHELIHLITCRADRAVESLEEPLGKLSWAVFESCYVDAAERSVDHLARLIAPLLPLPTIPADGWKPRGQIERRG